MRVAGLVVGAVAADAAFTGFGGYIEGAAADPDGNVYAVHFKDTATENTVGRNVIGQYNPVTDMTTAFYTGEATANYNGIRFDKEGKYMYLADPSLMKVTKVDVSVSPMVATTYCEGLPAGIPNDMALAKDGKLYLSGQDWGTSVGGLYVCDGTSTTATELDYPMGRTNGIALSPEDDILYLTEAEGSPVASNDGVQVIWKYDLAAGAISNKVKFFDMAADVTPAEASVDSDGMRTDMRGSLYVTRNGNGKVLEIDKTGALTASHPVPATNSPTNLVMSGADGKTLYVVGRCGDAGYGEGDGCLEEITVAKEGRQWNWFQPAMAPTTAMDSPTTGGMVDSSASAIAPLSVALACMLALL